MGDKWDRDLFENRLMGYGMRTERYRLVVWKDYTKPESEPVFWNCTITKLIRWRQRMLPVRTRSYANNCWINSTKDGKGIWHQCQISIIREKN